MVDTDGILETMMIHQSATDESACISIGSHVLNPKCLIWADKLICYFFWYTRRCPKVQKVTKHPFPETSTYIEKSVLPIHEQGNVV